MCNILTMKLITVRYWMWLFGCVVIILSFENCSYFCFTIQRVTECYVIFQFDSLWFEFGFWKFFPFTIFLAIFSFFRDDWNYLADIDRNIHSHWSEQSHGSSWWAFFADNYFIYALNHSTSKRWWIIWKSPSES